jgi:ribosomal protein S27AE
VIRWSPKLRLAKLERLYRSSAACMLDVDLLDDVGWTLYNRIADVERVTNSRVLCPTCGTEFAVAWLGEPRETRSSCPGCGWTVSAGEYHASWEHRDLHGRSPKFDDFLREFPRTRSTGDKLILVDRVVHALHVVVKGQAPHSAARNFLEGDRRRIAEVLDELAR